MNLQGCRQFIPAGRVDFFRTKDQQDRVLLLGPGLGDAVDLRQADQRQHPLVQLPLGFHARHRCANQEVIPEVVGDLGRLELIALRVSTLD